MIVIDGNGAVLGRLASYAAKEALKGEEIAVVNVDDIIITGNKEQIRRHYDEKRTKVGSTRKGPKISRDTERIVKRAIRGMLPNARFTGRGRDAIKRVKCYRGIPKEFESAKMIKFEENKFKFIKVGTLYK